MQAAVYLRSLAYNDITTVTFTGESPRLLYTAVGGVAIRCLGINATAAYVAYWLRLHAARHQQMLGITAQYVPAMYQHKLTLVLAVAGSGTPLWAVLAITVGCLGLVAAAGYVAYRLRLRNAMHQEIRSIMAQYMPLGEEADAEEKQGLRNGAATP